ncbi:MAG: hypothetical protein J6O49_16925 [Bacteroidaceae bacterium]|nr:hypothetical protein [Bacteroidaceae bacterium]
MIYSEERGTWNLIVDGEWYAEGNYEYIEKMYDINRMCEIEDQEARYDYD